MSYDVQHWCTISSTNKRGHSLFILVCASTVRTKHFLWMWDGLKRCQGTLSIYQSNISKNKLELKQTRYNDIDWWYFNQLIQFKTTEMANKDLDRYCNALDKCWSIPYQI
ncbi:DNA repair protein Rad50 eukaryotes protein [Dioscorea alata]|uniref:DNA repair protein Rad50 eukaryotes protein n=1 Tax=Dioscorea alata TaxID=55571 RepID=A0ACB7UHU8_DIOAL|nr:DNA repair protein Rad50 eukaryotes protein [Dioscorea alata]